jgi:hypothetical protein
MNKPTFNQVNSYKNLNEEKQPIDLWAETQALSAEDWWKSQGHKVPKSRKSVEWRDMYNSWVEKASK